MLCTLIPTVQSTVLQVPLQVPLLLLSLRLATTCTVPYHQPPLLVAWYQALRVVAGEIFSVILSVRWAVPGKGRYLPVRYGTNHTVHTDSQVLHDYNARSCTVLLYSTSRYIFALSTIGMSFHWHCCFECSMFHVRSILFNEMKNLLVQCSKLAFLNWQEKTDVSVYLVHVFCLSILAELNSLSIIVVSCQNY